MEDILIGYQKGVRTITLNRPSKKNAITTQMYLKITTTLNEDSINDDIIVTIITGNGDYFSSGTDLMNTMASTEPLDGQTPKPLLIFEEMVNAFITYPKVIIAVVNGPAIGIAATMVALCDIVYATESAVFFTPFVKIGFCAEGASSMTFPFILGRSKASEMLLLGQPLTAFEAYHFGLVSNVIPRKDLDKFIENLYQYGELPVRLIKANKKLIMANIESNMSNSGKRELEQLKACVMAEDFADIVMQSLSKKSKL